MYAQKLGHGGMLDGGNDKVNYSKTLGSKSGGQASRQYSLTMGAAELYKEVKVIEAHDSTRSSPKLLTRTTDMKRLLDVFTPGVKRTFLQLGAIAVATDLHDQDGYKLKSQDMQAGGGYNKSIEGMVSQKLSAATKGKLRASGFTGGAATTTCPFTYTRSLPML